MLPYPRRRILPLLLTFALTACGGGDGDGDGNGGGDPEPPLERGALIGQAELVATYSPTDLLALADLNDIVHQLVDIVVTPDCEINVYHFEYQTVDPAGDGTPGSAALMVPAGSGSNCTGERPIVLYGHGTHAERTFNMANLEASDNSEALLMATLFASEGYIVVAPNYVGYDTSTLGYHPYLNGDQQSKDMIDALTAARSALPTEDAPDTLDDGRLFVTGYSQGGYVAMATHRALEEEGETVTASAPMSGPYATSAFGDAIFQGRVTISSPLNLALLLTSYQNAYGNVYGDTTEAYEAPYAEDVETLLPSTMSLSQLVADGKLPASALFSSTPPHPSYATMTPATSPADLAPVFAAGFGADHLLTNDFRLAYLQDADNNPDGGFPDLSDGLPPENSSNTLRLALKTNDQRAWTPTAPMLLCAGHGDPTVLYLNTELMQEFWASETTVTVLDIASAVESGDPFASQKTQFALAKNLLEISGGDDAVLEAYHAGLVAPFCLSAVRQYFDGQ
jgi:dienelactone hydrolase